MVRKLLKHELSAMGRVIVLVQGILLVAATFMRVLLCFETDHVVYEIVSFFAWLVYGTAVLGCLLVPLVMGIIRYYRNLFTAEGYLSFTLPVTPAQHIVVKTVAALVWEIASFVTVLVSLCIVMLGEVFREVMLAAGYLLRQMPSEMVYHLVGWIAEAVVLFALVFVGEVLLYNACISVGQLARKNRILLAFGVYFGYYVVIQIVETVLMVTLALLEDQLPWDDWVMAMMEHPCLTGHLAMGVLIVFAAVFAGIYFMISHTIIRKRLNLE